MPTDPWEEPTAEREAPPLAPPPFDLPSPTSTSPPPHAGRWFGAPALDFGRVLGTGFATWARSLVPFTLLGVIVHLPLFAFLVLTYREGFDPGDPASGGAALVIRIVTMVLQFVLSLVLTGAIVHGVFERLRGRRPGYGAILSTGLSRVFPVLGVSILVGLAFAACILPGTLVMIAGLLASHGSPSAVFLGVILFLAGLVPVCVLWSMWYVAVPAAVMERVGVVGSLQRSQALTHGSRWLVFALFLILALGGGMVVGIAQFALLTSLSHTPDGLLMTQLVVQLIGILTGLLGNVMMTVVYCELRGIKEGATPDDLAEIFA